MNSTYVISDINAIILEDNTATNATNTPSAECDSIWGVIFQVEGAAIVTLNFVLFVFIMKKIKRLRSRHVTTCFLNLQAAHILFGIMLIISQSTALRIVSIISAALLLQMFLSMLLKTIDQFLFIKFPYKYQHVTSRDVIKMVALTWIVSLLFALISIFAVDLTNFKLLITLTFIMVVSMLVLASCNFGVYVIAQRHYVAIKSQVPHYYRGETSLRKPLLTCLIIVVTFCLLWIPYLIHNILALSDIFQPGRHKTFSQLVLLIASLNAIGDPLIFVWFNRDLKKQMVKFKRTSMKPLRKRGSNQGDEKEKQEKTFLQTESSMI